MQDFKNLKVWQATHVLTLDVYGATRGFPREEQFGLTSQLRRCAASIPANIAEGSGRQGKKDFARFLDVAGGSANELEYHLLLARDLGLLPDSHHEALSSRLMEVRKMLVSLTVRLRPKSDD